MPKGNNTLNKLKDAIIGKEEQKDVIVFNTTSSSSPPSSGTAVVPVKKKQKRKYTKRSPRWTTQKDVSDAILKDISSASCCNNSGLGTLTIDPITPAAPAVVTTTTRAKRKYNRRRKNNNNNSQTTIADPSKFKKINAWKSPWEKQYVMMTLTDEDRKHLAYIQKVLKSINSAQVLRDGLKREYERMKQIEKEKKLKK